MSDKQQTTMLIGSGFLGSYIVEGFMKKGRRLIVVDNKDYDAFQYHPKVVEYKDNPDLVYLWNDLQDSINLKREIEDEDVSQIIYTVAIADVPFAIKNPRATTRVNVLNTLEFMEFLRAIDYDGKFLLTSSESIYGHQAPEKYPLKEDDVVPRPANIYGLTKLFQESIVRNYFDCYGMKNTIFRSSTMFGPFGRMKQAIPDFVLACLQGVPVIMTSDGSPTREFKHVANMVDAMELYMEADEGLVIGQTFNIGSGHEIKIMDLVKGIKHFLKSRSSISFGEQRPGEKGLRVALSIEKAREILKYEPQINLFEPEGLGEVALWIAYQKLMWPQPELDKLAALVGKRFGTPELARLTGQEIEEKKV